MADTSLTAWSPYYQDAVSWYKDKFKGSGWDMWNGHWYTNEDYKNMQELASMNYQNWYNSPSHQMELFKQAGLNPNLIYQQAGPTQSAAPSFVPSGSSEQGKWKNFRESIDIITEIFSQMNNSISAIQGVQDIGMNVSRSSLLENQDYFSTLRRHAFENGDLLVGSKEALLGAGYTPYQITYLGDGIFVRNKDLFLFPEMFKAFQDTSKRGSELDFLSEFLSERNRNLSEGASLREKQNKVDELIESIVKSLSSGEIDYQDILKLILIQSLRRY